MEERLQQQELVGKYLVSLSISRTSKPSKEQLEEWRQHSEILGLF